ncbi:MAG: TonB-dependent receptor, partial [Novosphingobium sp.]
MGGKLVLLSGASALAFLAQPALAQTASTSRPSEATSGESDQGIGEIIVTAQRRAQRLQDVPIAISAIGASSLANAGVTGTTQLQAVAPSLQINQSFGPANIFMRGIGFKSGDLLAESSVAIYVDGVYQPNAVANIFEFNGVERVEVLKGPQGTLFGRNATGGVVQVITKAPSFAPEMNFEVGYANYETVRASAYVSGGLTENLAANVAVQYQNQNKGWGRNITTGEKRGYSRNFNLRGKLLFTPGDATEITLSGNYTNFNRQNLDPQNPPGAVLATGQGYLGRYQVAGDSNTEATGRSYGGSLTATHDFGGFQIRNIAAYQKVTMFQGLDQDASALPLVRGDFHFRSRMITEEFHVLAPSDAKFQWLAGVYYFNFDGFSDPVDITGLVFGGPGQGVAVYGQSEARSIAGFAQGTYPLTDKLNLTAGIRYTRDKVTYVGSVNLAGTSIVIDPEQTKQYKNSKPTWRLSLDY